MELHAAVELGLAVVLVVILVKVHAEI